MKKNTLLYVVCWIVIVIGLMFVSIVIGIWNQACKLKKSIMERDTRGVKIIHLMYLPWDKQQKLKVDCHDFDKSYYRQMKKQYPKYHVLMWTRDMLEKEFPNEFKLALMRHSRPTQLVDLFRWMVVQKFGGTYVQYDSEIFVPIDRLFPSVNKSLRLFTESVLSRSACDRAAQLYPIRKGESEESVRVMNQVFSALPNNDFVIRMCHTILENMKQPVTEDYDILYLGANALVSMLYDKYGKHDKSVELTNICETRYVFKASSRGSWRTGK